MCVVAWVMENPVTLETMRAAPCVEVIVAAGAIVLVALRMSEVAAAMRAKSIPAFGCAL
jgi:hypothetical protein